MFLKKILIKSNNFFLFFGINFTRLLSLRFLPEFLFDLYSFKKLGGKIHKIRPELGQKRSFSGSVGQYFYQDLLVANYIYEQNPRKHVDVGSRIDGFVANVSSFRKIEVLDIRNNNLDFKNIKFINSDINSLDSKFYNYTDSLSCLHSIEHFGLGRYGDKLDPKGHTKGFMNLLRMLNKNGKLYISFPLSSENINEFNAQRFFKIDEVLNWSEDIELTRFDYINNKNKLYLNQNINDLKNKFNIIDGCGIYTFTKL